jgi:sarcosine oxidase
MVYQEHPSYVSWLKRSFELWRRLEKEENENLLVTTGCLNASTERAVGAHGHSCYQGAVESAELHNLPHTKLTAAEANSQFPAFSFPENFKALYDPAGGFLYPEKAISAFVSSAKKNGATVVCNSPVASWKSVAKEEDLGRGGGDRGGGGSEEVILVETKTGEKYTTQRLVLTAGAWMSELVPELAPVLSVERQVVGWFGPTVGKEKGKNPTTMDGKIKTIFSPENCPAYLIDDDEGYFYGFPADENNLAKIGKYNHLNQCVSVVDDLDRKIHPEDEEALRTCLRKYLPGLGGTPMQLSSVCMFTNTPDNHFILDYHPKYRPPPPPPENSTEKDQVENTPVVVLGSACSGHGFKFAPVLGEIIGNLALNKEKELHISLEGLQMHTLDGNRHEKFKDILKIFATV